MQATFTCPVLGGELEFELPEDEAFRDAAWTQTVDLSCPICDGIHSLKFRDAYVSASLAEFTCLPADVLKAPLH
jgi:hypothetical protein